MGKELPPLNAAQLALGAYEVNSGDDRRLKAFLANQIFSQKAGKTLLQAEVGGRILKATKDAFGLCAVGAGAYQGDLFLIFRGTTTANNHADFLTDARIGIATSKTGLPVHTGFNHAFNSMLPDIRQFINRARATGYIHCVGHSLGGAVASLAADWISKNTGYTAKLYSFGAPRVGTDWFVKSTTSSVSDLNMHRVYHRTDPVSMVPLYPFMQAPYTNTGHFIYSAEPLFSGAAHSMGKYMTSVNGQNWKQLSAVPDQPYSVESAIENWLKSKSPVDSSSSSFWRWVESALIYVIRKITMNSLLAIQSVSIGTFTVADKLAYILAKGIDLADQVSMWIELLMAKLMQALHMQAVSGKKQLTRDLIRYVLIRLSEKANRDARNAIRKSR